MADKELSPAATDILFGKPLISVLHKHEASSTTLNKLKTSQHRVIQPSGIFARLVTNGPALQSAHNRPLSLDALNLQTVEGFNQVFFSPPTQSYAPRPLCLNQNSNGLLSCELCTLCKKGAIKLAPNTSSFLSTMFFVQKKSDEFHNQPSGSKLIFHLVPI